MSQLMDNLDRADPACAEVTIRGEVHLLGAVDVPRAMIDNLPIE